MASFALLLRLAAAQVLVAAAAVFVGVHKPFAAVLALVVAAGWGSMSDNLAAALAAELDLPSSRSNNRHY